MFFDPGSRPGEGWRRDVYVILFETDTVAGRRFDIALLVAILLSLVAVALDSVPNIHDSYEVELFWTEIVLTALFTVEYVLRLISVERPLRYALSFIGIIDLLSILPTFLEPLLFEGSTSLMAVRTLRLLRVFRVFKLGNFMREGTTLLMGLRASRHRIAVFLVVVTTLVFIQGSLLYVIEGPSHGFTSIPKSVYWAIVTLTTVGYGDIAPETPLGQAIAASIMLLGYGIIVVPTGIISTEVAKAAASGGPPPRGCESCGFLETDAHAQFCRSCGAELPDHAQPEIVEDHRRARAQLANTGRLDDATVPNNDGVPRVPHIPAAPAQVEPTPDHGPVQADSTPARGRVDDQRAPDQTGPTQPELPPTKAPPTEPSE